MQLIKIIAQYLQLIISSSNLAHVFVKIENVMSKQEIKCCVVHSRVHRPIHTNTYTHIHTYIHTYIRTYNATQQCTHTYMQKYMHTYTSFDKLYHM